MNDFLNINFAILKNDLIRDEGIGEFPYNDKTGNLVQLPEGHITIGIGRNLEAKPLSQEIIELMFVEDSLEAIASLKSIFKNFDYFSQERAHALVNMMFNLGKGGFSKFHKMITAIHLGDWSTAAKEAKDSIWYSQVGERARRIVEAFNHG